MSRSKPRLTMDEIRALKARGGIAKTGHTEREAHYPYERRPLFSEREGHGRAVNEEIRQFDQTRTFENFPTGLVTTALRALDVLAPDEMLKTVETIALMYVKGSSVEEIAKVVDLPVEVVKKEVGKLPGARMVAMTAAPDLAIKTVEVTLDAMKEAVDLIKMGKDVLEMMKTEITESFDSRHAIQEVETTNENGETAKKKVKKGGISNFKSDSFFNGMKSMKESLELVAKMQGLLAPAVNKTVNQNTIQVNGGSGTLFESEKLNNVVDMLMRQAGVNVDDGGPCIDV